jgi:two-component sensor histidine kinase
MAMVCASPTPLLLLDAKAMVLAASASFCDTFGIDCATAPGRPVFSLGGGEWDVPQLRSLVDATASGDASIESYDLDLKSANGSVRNLVLSVRKLTYGDAGEARLILGIAEVTKARAMAAREIALAKDNAVLAQEARHRIANSLQIIASLMMINARRTSSVEARSHLTDAHNRVMSVADLQQQLAVSTDGAVELRAYLSRLCQSITASMIADPAALSIVVVAPEIDIDPDIAVSLGLIVTELVINALKHGFPDGAGGVIDVAYAGAGANWTLTVSDSGVGMPGVDAKAMPGLGTSIVQALARQLGARVEVRPSGPGARVSIIHAEAPPAD